MMQYFRNEKHFMSSVTKAAQQAGWLVQHGTIAVYSAAGFPDLVMIKPGQPVIFAELKMPKGRLTPKQKEWGNLLMDNPGVAYYLWRPEHWDRIIDLLFGFQHILTDEDQEDG